MSVGFQARADLVASDDSGFLYAYACCNLNLQETGENVWKMEDGEIWLSRNALAEPEIHKKVRRLPSGKKKTTAKRIPHWVSVWDLISSGKVTVRNASGTWITENSVDMMALRLIQSILREYQEKGEIPDRVVVAW